VTATLGDAPDWQGYSQWRASQGTMIDETISIGNPYKSQVVVTNWASFNLYAVLNSGTGFTIIVTWFNDAAYSQVVDQQEWVLNVSNILNVTLPCLTPYAEIEYATAESGNQNIKSYFTPQNLAVTKATYLTDNNVVAENSVTVGASDTVTYNVPYVMAGPAWLTVAPGDLDGKLNIWVNALTESGALYGQIFYTGSSETTYDAIPVRMAVPPWPIQIKVTNTDASASHEVELYYQGLSQ